MVCYATMEDDSSAVDPTLYGWRRDELSKVFVSTGSSLDETHLDTV